MVATRGFDGNYAVTRHLPGTVAAAVSHTARGRMALNEAILAVDRSPSGVTWEELFVASSAFEEAAKSITDAVETARTRYALARMEETS